jgi:hypothetical protein
MVAMCVGCVDPPPDGAEWCSRSNHGEFYSLGVRAQWRGVMLVCTLAHHAGENADHPWDPGWGWSAEKAATLWAPDGDVEAAKLRAEINGIRNDGAHVRPLSFGVSRRQHAFAREHGHRLRDVCAALTRQSMA